MLKVDRWIDHIHWLINRQSQVHNLPPLALGYSDEAVGKPSQLLFDPQIRAAQGSGHGMRAVQADGPFQRRRRRRPAKSAGLGAVAVQNVRREGFDRTAQLQKRLGIARGLDLAAHFNHERLPAALFHAIQKRQQRRIRAGDAVSEAAKKIQTQSRFRNILHVPHRPAAGGLENVQYADGFNRHIALMLS